MSQHPSAWGRVVGITALVGLVGVAMNASCRSQTPPPNPVTLIPVVCSMPAPRVREGAVANLRYDGWSRLLLKDYQSGFAAGNARDCMNQPVEWRDFPGRCEEYCDDPANEARSEEDRCKAPQSSAVPQRAISEDDVVVSRLTGALRLVWIITDRFTNGEGVGPVALVEFMPDRVAVRGEPREQRERVLHPLALEHLAGAGEVVRGEAREGVGHRGVAVGEYVREGRLARREVGACSGLLTGGGRDRARGRSGRAGRDGAGARELRGELGEGGEARVALEEHGHRPTRRRQRIEQREHRLGHRRRVVVEEEAALRVAARDVDHRDPVEGVGPEHFEGVAALVEGVGVEVPEVEQERAAGGAGDLAVEVLLAHGVVGPARGPRDVLEQQRDVREVPPRARDVARHRRHRLARPRELREVPHLPAPGARQRDVLAHHGRPQRARELAEAARAVFVDPLRAPERQLHPVRHHRPRLRERRRLAPRPRLREAQLRHHLDERHRPARVEDVGRDLLAPPDPNACEFSAHRVARRPYHTPRSRRPRDSPSNPV
jgi:hypothetical protein